MSKKPSIFKGLLNLIHGSSGDSAKSDLPSSSKSTNTSNGASPRTRTNLSTIAPENVDQSGNVNTPIDNSMAFERLAAQLQKEDKAEINAGVKAYSNQEYDEAIAHYKKASAINPGDGSIYNNIGNVYLRGKEDAETALQYYAEATKIEPSFNYGWLNLALCQRELGDLEGAKTTLAQGVNVLNNEDVLYNVLIQLQSQFN